MDNAEHPIQHLAFAPDKMDFCNMTKPGETLWLHPSWPRCNGKNPYRSRFGRSQSRWACRGYCRLAAAAAQDWTTSNRSAPAPPHAIAPAPVQKVTPSATSAHLSGARFAICSQCSCSYFVLLPGTGAQKCKTAANTGAHGHETNKKWSP